MDSAGERAAVRVVARGVKITPNVMGGIPCVAGQRIPTRTIASFAKAGYNVADIQAEFPSLLVFQIADALAWEMRPKRVRTAIERNKGQDDA